MMRRMMSAPPKEIGRRRKRTPPRKPETRLVIIWRAVKTTARRAWDTILRRNK